MDIANAVLDGMDMSDAGNSTLHGDDILTNEIDGIDDLLVENADEEDLLAAAVGDAPPKVDDSPAGTDSDAVSDDASAGDETEEVLEFADPASGENIAVPLSELADNYLYQSQIQQRQAEIERREKMLVERAREAQQGLQLADAIAANPQAALAALAAEWNVPIQFGAGTAPQQPPAQQWDDPYGLPADQPSSGQPPPGEMPAWAQQLLQRQSQMEQAIAQRDEQIGQLAAVGRDRAHREEFATFEQELPKHGVSYEEAARHWADQRFPSLKAAWRDLAMPRLQERRQRMDAAAAQRRKEARSQQQLNRSAQAAGARNGETNSGGAPAADLPVGVAGAADRAIRKLREQGLM